MPILIDRTFSETTDESAEHGEHSDSGFIAINEQCTFRELVDYLKSCSESSCRPSNGETFVWFSTDNETDIYSGETRQENIHYSRDNLPRNAKYWRMAAHAAGLSRN